MSLRFSRVFAERLKPLSFPVLLKLRLIRGIKNFFLDIPAGFGIIIKLSCGSELHIVCFPEQLWRSRLVGRGRMIGNHVNLQGFQGFESLLLRHQKSL